MSALLAELTIRGSVVYLAVWALNALLGARMQARWRRLWWILVPVAFLLPWKASLLPETVSHLPVHGPTLESLVKVMVQPIVSTPGTNALTPASIFVIVWILGAATSFALLALGAFKTSRLWSAKEFTTDSRLLKLLEECRKSAGVTAPIGLVVSDEIGAPAILGWLRPRILLPRFLAEESSDMTLRHIVLHELAHFRAMDLPLSWLFAVARCVHWFNPLAYLAERHCSAFCEEAADESAIRWGSEPSPYGETLLSLIRAQSQPRTFGVLAIGETFSNVKHRILMITRHTQRSPRSILAILLTAVLAALTVLQPANAESQDDKKAIASMESWLSLIDEGKYAQSWNESATSFQNALSSKTWEEQIAAARKPLGPVLSRELKSSQFQTEVASPTGVAKGEFIVAQFATSFTNLKSAIETVCFERQGGEWKASGYYIKPG